MKRKNLKLVCIAMIVVVIACVVTYAGKHKQKKPCLPAEAWTALEALYPNAKIEEVEVRKEGLKVYEIELEQYGQDVEVTLTSDGTLMAVETEIAPKELPSLVSMAVTKVAKDAAIEEVERELNHAMVKLVKFARPEIHYEVELSKDGSKCEIEFAMDGTILEQSEWKKCDKDKASKTKCDKDKASKPKCDKDKASKPKCDKGDK